MPPKYFLLLALSCPPLYFLIEESNSGNNDQCQNASKCQINKVYFHKKAKERVEVQVFPVTVVAPGGKERTDQHIIYNMTNNNKMVTCEVDSVVD